MIAALWRSCSLPIELPGCAQVIGVARTCSVILLVLAADKPITHKQKIEYELEGFGMRCVVLQCLSVGQYVDLLNCADSIRNRQILCSAERRRVESIFRGLAD